MILKPEYSNNIVTWEYKTVFFILNSELLCAQQIQNICITFVQF